MHRGKFWRLSACTVTHGKVCAQEACSALHKDGSSMLCIRRFETLRSADRSRWHRRARSHCHRARHGAAGNLYPDASRQHRRHKCAPAASLPAQNRNCPCSRSRRFRVHAGTRCAGQDGFSSRACSRVACCHVCWDRCSTLRPPAAPVTPR